MPLFSRIARSIQGRMSKSVEDNPDGALAKYLWLWQSMGRRHGRRLIPRSVRFFLVVSLDVFSLFTGPGKSSIHSCQKKRENCS